MYFVLLFGKWESDELRIKDTSNDHVLLVPQDTYIRVYTHCKEEFTAKKAAKSLQKFYQDRTAANKPPDRAGGFYALSILKMVNGQFEGHGVTVEALEKETLVAAGNFVRVVGHADTPEAAQVLAEAGIRQTVWYVFTHARKFKPEQGLQPYHFSPAIQEWLASMPSSK